jgi:hypothetical protein
MERRWRKIRQLADLEWVTPRIFRKTVATLISERVDANTASQQLGHSSPSITGEFYIAKPAIAGDVGHVLQDLAALTLMPLLVLVSVAAVGGCSSGGHSPASPATSTKSTSSGEAKTGTLARTSRVHRRSSDRISPSGGGGSGDVRGH